MSSSLGKIGQNGVNEFFEDLTYNVAYGEVIQRLNKVIDTDNETINSALKSAMTVMVSSALFLYIQKQEQFLQKIYKIVAAIVIAQLGLAKGLLGKFKGKIGGRKGRIAKNIMSFFGDSKENAINKSRLAVQAGQLLVSGDGNLNTGSSVFNMSEQMKNGMIQNESHKLNIARSKVASMNETLLFKLFTKNFTSSDMDLINRITGGKSKELTADKLNQVADFMYVSDDKGNITGLSEEFMKMLNGLGYLNNKGAN